jgi:hypothetical protein
VILQDADVRENEATAPMEPPPFLLQGDEEARSNATVPDLSNWQVFVDFELARPEVAVTFDNLVDFLQATFPFPPPGPFPLFAPP